MNLTSSKYYGGERARLTERRDAITADIRSLNERLTDARREAALLDDLIERLDAHLPAPAAIDITGMAETFWREASA